MRKLFYLAIVFIGLCVCQSSPVNAQGVSVNPSGSPPDPSAMFDISSTTKGVLISRMTTIQRDAIASPVQGLLIYNIDCNTINFWNGGAWIAMGNNTSINTPGTITGNSTPCPNATGVSYSISAVTNATSYNWTVPTGASIISGQGTTDIKVNFGITNGNICVTASNACGTSSPNCLAISFSLALSAPTAAAHTSSATQIVWNWNTVSGATGYKYNTANNDYLAATDIGTSTSYTQANLTCNTSYTLYVWAYDACGNSSATTLSQTTSGCVKTVKVFVIGGGGAGGGGGGGGGAGGYQYDAAHIVTAGAYTITIGAGGVAIDGNPGGDGGNSVFGTITAYGGGGGGHFSIAGHNGGSGGGGGYTSGAGGIGVLGQGNNGGTATASPTYRGGGGGGANASGANGISSGNGGDGIANTITGSSVYYAGGGGGGCDTGHPPGAGGSGGGGAGAVIGTATAGTANTGGGGGGGWSYGCGCGGGANGGSGIVIIRYVTADFGACTGGTIDNTSVPGETIHIFNSSGTFTVVF